MKKTIAFGLFIFTGIFLQAQTLSWDIKFFKGSERETIPVNRIITMETGEEFQISIVPDSDCFGYVIAYDSQRKIHILHNAPLRKDTVLNLGPMKLTTPSGTETFFIVMGLNRETRLENLIQAYNNNRNSGRHAENLRREIARLQNAVSSLGEPASVFIPSGGTTRGTTGGTTGEYTNRFSGKSVYVRTVTIRH